MAFRRSSTRGFKRTGSLLNEQIRKTGETRGFAVSRLLTHWTETVGPEMAAIAKPVNIGYGRGSFGATLTVLTTGAQAPMLEMQKEQLRERVNAVYGYNAISKVRITQTAPVGFSDGQVEFKYAPKVQQPLDPDPQVQTEASQVADGVESTELRAALERLARSVLTKQKTLRKGLVMTRLMSGVFTAVAVVAGAYALTGSQGQGNMFIGAAAAQEAAAEIDTSTITEMVQGAEDAPVTLIEYASYTCPHCARFHSDVYKQLKADYIDTGKVKFVYREVYFDRYGLWASLVARCGGEDKFFGITDLLFKGQSTWARAGGAPEIVEELRKIGRLAGLENDQLEACLQDGTKAQTLVTWYQENATKDGVESTPSFVLNGEKVANQSYDKFKEMIDAELGS